MKKIVIYLPEALEFLLTIDKTAANKLVYNVKKIRMGVVDTNVFKKLTGTNIWEFRALYDGNCYRLLSFWDTRTETLIVATHGFVKKSTKTPRKEIDRAETIRKEYFNDKNK
ncbi:MAG: type II toxin-antitoxin system RelE/ParE family toxin [Bacteroidales bacterium]|nr:type II toxin-antitoxin system RelE/ParE family toxin [Bacteroidales bacterium]